MELVASFLGDEGVDVLLGNGDRVFVEPFGPKTVDPTTRIVTGLHPADLKDGEMRMTEDGWMLIRRGEQVVIIATPDHLRPAQRAADDLAEA
jgi:hypothetical protein